MEPIFYTFSTITQTLAGAIALLGAFVLYRLNSLNTQMGTDAGQLFGSHTSAPGTENKDKAYAYLIEKNYLALFNLPVITEFLAGAYRNAAHICDLYRLTKGDFQCERSETVRKNYSILFSLENLMYKPRQYR